MSAGVPLQASFGSSYQASKWQSCHVLLEAEEMKELFDVLGHFWIVQISGLIPIGQEMIPREDFLSFYNTYIATLKEGVIPADNRLRTYFSSVFTIDLNALYAVKVNQEQSVVKIRKPVVQLQSHRFDYSLADGKFRSMVLGYDSVHWGLQFSYPHLYQDDNMEVFTVRESDQFPNTALFKQIQRWIRSHTMATPFEVNGKQVNVPIRLGRQCLSWINSHPQLSAKGLRILTNG
jgi:hypothetical protein